jgi:hypothetical protein
VFLKETSQGFMKKSTYSSIQNNIDYFENIAFHPSLDIKDGILVLGFRTKPQIDKEENIFLAVYKGAIPVEPSKFSIGFLFINLIKNIMRSVLCLCRRVEKREPDYSSYLCLAHAVRGRGFSRETLGIALQRLVDKDDYNTRDKRRLLDNLGYLSHPLVERKISTEFVRGEKQSTRVV